MLTNSGIVGRNGSPAEHAKIEALGEGAELLLDVLMVKLVEEEDARCVLPERRQVDLVGVPVTKLCNFNLYIVQNSVSFRVNL